MGGGPTGRELFGRDEQIAAVRSAVARAGVDFHVVLLTGQAGIGKTAIWESGIAEADERGYAILQTRASESEARMSHGGLSDLLEHVGDEVFERLALPQRRAIDAALLRAETGPIDPRALGAGFLSIVRELAIGGAVLIAIDDDQWLDAASGTAVMYALRRLRGEHVTVLLTRRTDPTSTRYDSDGLTPELGTVPAEASTVDLDPLPPDAIQRLVDHPLPPRLGQRVYELSGGNPYFALEIAGALRRSVHPIGAGDDLPVPSSLRALVSARLAAASPGARRAVLVTSLVSNPRLGLVRDVLARDDPARADLVDGDLDDALADGLIFVRGDHVLPAHPLLGAGARAEAPAAACRRLHRAIADVAGDIEERARHRALGTIPPDAAIADELAGVAEATTGRGGMRAAAELAEQAWRFTPTSDPRRDDRLIAAATWYAAAGRHEAGVALLAPHLAAFPPGPRRAQARLLHIQMSYTQMSPAHYEESLAEADSQVRAEILANRANHGLHSGTVPVAQALVWGAEAVEISSGLGDPAAHATVVFEAAWMDAMLGNDPEPWLATLDAGPLPDLPLHDHGDRVRAVHAVWRGDMKSARRLLEELRTLAREREDEWSEGVFMLHLFEAAIRVGDWIAAEEVRSELADMVVSLIVGSALITRIKAAVAAGTGDRATAVAALEHFDYLASRPESDQPSAPSMFWDHMETRRVAGQAALFDGDAETAVALLGRVVADAAAGDYRDPGLFPARPDLVEALVKAGRLDDAREALRHLDAIATELEHPWARAGAARARGILLSASAASASASASASTDDEAEAALTQAVHRYRDLGLPFDEARAVAALGTLRRRQRRFREARALLQDASERFERLGALGLARSTRDDASRVGGRVAEAAATTGGLTATEQQVVDLVVEGCTNRQAADRLFISVSAVEAHLTRVYAKFGVASRTQLVRKLSSLS